MSALTIEGKPEIATPIPSPFIDPIAESRGSYTIYYNRFSGHDSPTASRTSLVERLHAAAATLPKDSLVLDFGSGRQAVEEEYGKYLAKHGLKTPRCQIVTFDIADLTPDQLVGQGEPHIQASGHTLPFASETFPMVISNMALDFMPDMAKSELLRVAKPGAPIFLNLHHPTLIPEELDSKIYKLEKQINQRMRYKRLPPTLDQQFARSVLLHKLYLRDHSILFSYPEHIREAYEKAGFEISRIALGNDPAEFSMWWEVDMRKPDPNERVRNRIKGKLIADVIAAIQGRQTSDALKDKSLRELSLYDNSEGRALTKFVAKLEEVPLTDRKPFINALLNEMGQSFFAPI